MERLSETLAADVTRKKDLYPPPVSDSQSLPSSYKDYPAHRPLINTVMHPTTRTCSHPLPSPRKAFPETSSAEILSALRNLQEKIRRLESEKSQAELSLCALRRDASHRYQQSNNRVSSNHTEAERDTGSQSDCNQVLITHLAAAESRCVKLERQLDHMRRMLRSASMERAGPIKMQLFTEKEKSQTDTVLEQIQLEKLERLEQEYLRLTRTQNITEMKICELEMKLQEEEIQRRLIQAKAKQLQTGLQTNRLLLQAVSPRLSLRRSKEKTTTAKESPQHHQQQHHQQYHQQHNQQQHQQQYHQQQHQQYHQQLSSCTRPHYRLSLRDVPFVAGMAVGDSHSVRANVQSVLSLLKQHQPHLCNSRVLSGSVSRSDRGGHSHTERSSSSSCTSEDELSELLQGLQEELRLMSLEQDVLMKQADDTDSDRERKALQREQEKLLLKMEMKGEQISILYKHKSKIKKLRKEVVPKPDRGKRTRAANTGSTRGRSTGVKASPGEKSKRNLRLLRDMKALQSSLQT
ncbi:centrosomal protein of 57 kDa [Gouania willdenowi]|uniref:Centrosomal protein of 57 kDa-like n=1 Tax=Gouania willdenowi TaxID=441366 RepID=A0A8C5GI40_GOUWI|nr:centrosomal protein of 57 kDa-like [Gouania willdenowi]